MTDVQTRDNPDSHRYEAWVGDRLAGFATYEEGDGQVVFTHTEVGDDFGGQGVGSALARGALDDVRARGDRQVVPRCEFIRGWMDKHPEYADLRA